MVSKTSAWDITCSTAGGLPSPFKAYLVWDRLTLKSKLNGEWSVNKVIFFSGLISKESVQQGVTKMDANLHGKFRCRKWMILKQMKERGKKDNDWFYLTRSLLHLFVFVSHWIGLISFDCFSYQVNKAIITVLFFTSKGINLLL